MAVGEPYEEYSRVFYYASNEVKRDARANPLITVFFILLAFASLSLAFLGDKKTQSIISYTFYALVASLSIGLGSIYLSNTVGVYV